MAETNYNIKSAPRIALLADFHNGDPELIIASLDRHKDNLDLIAIAGDLIYGAHPEDDKSPLDTQENVLKLLSSCASIAPTYMGLGNHEWMLNESDLDSITSTGVVVLDNEWIETDIKTHDNKPVIIGGLTSGHVLEYRKFIEELKAVADGTLSPGETHLLSPSVTPQEARERLLSAYPKRHPSDFQKPDRKAVRGAGRHDHDHRSFPSVSWLERFSRLSGYKVLLSHHPEYYDLIDSVHVDPEAPAEPTTPAAPVAQEAPTAPSLPAVDLLLCGHTHGGQWRLFNRGLFAPGQGSFPKYSKGVYGRMVISAGLTNTTWVPRINNPTEIVYINCP